MADDRRQISTVGTVANLKADLEARKGTLKEILPSHISIEKFTAAATTAAMMNPSILSCERASVFMALTKCAADGLVPDGREAALVPFQGKAQYLPMIFGVIKVMRNSAELASVWSDVVYEGEELTVFVEDGERKFNHKFDPLKRGGQVIGAYAVAKMKDGTIEFEPMGREQIEKRRRSSSNQRSNDPTGVWQQWYEEMARKTVIKALAKRLPLSSDDLRRVQEIDEQEIVAPEVKLSIEERLRAAQQPAAEAHDEDGVLADDAEVVEDKAAGPTYDATQWAPMDPEFEEGVAAAEAGKDEMDNPYPDNPQFSAWLGGFRGSKARAAG